MQLEYSPIVKTNGQAIPKLRHITMYQINKKLTCHQQANTIN